MDGFVGFVGENLEETMDFRNMGHSEWHPAFLFSIPQQTNPLRKGWYHGVEGLKSMGIQRCGFFWDLTGGLGADHVREPWLWGSIFH